MHTPDYVRVAATFIPEMWSKALSDIVSSVTSPCFFTMI